MKTFFNYCFYRYAKFYKEWGDSRPYIMAFGLLFLTIAFYLGSILNMVLFLTGIEYTNKINLGVIIFCIILNFVFCFLLDAEGRYKTLEKKYKSENNAKLKGWGVGLFIVFGLICYIVSLVVFKTA